MYWSYVLAAVGIVGLYLLGSKKRVGWLIGIFAQILWVVYAFATQQYGFILSAVAYAFVNIRGYKLFEKKTKKYPGVVEMDVVSPHPFIETCLEQIPAGWAEESGEVECELLKGHSGFHYSGRWSWMTAKEAAYQYQCTSVAPWLDSEGTIVICNAPKGHRGLHGGNGWSWNDSDQPGARYNTAFKEKR